MSKNMNTVIEFNSPVHIYSCNIPSYYYGYEVNFKFEFTYITYNATRSMRIAKESTKAYFFFNTDVKFHNNQMKFISNEIFVYLQYLIDIEDFDGINDIRR